MFAKVLMKLDNIIRRMNGTTNREMVSKQFNRWLVLPGRSITKVIKSSGQSIVPYVPLEVTGTALDDTQSTATHCFLSSRALHCMKHHPQQHTVSCCHGHCTVWQTIHSNTQFPAVTGTALYDTPSTATHCFLSSRALHCMTHHPQQHTVSCRHGHCTVWHTIHSNTLFPVVTGTALYDTPSTATHCFLWWWWWCRPHPVREHAQDLRPPLGAHPASTPHVKQRRHPHGVRPQIPDR